MTTILAHLRRHSAKISIVALLALPALLSLQRAIGNAPDPNLAPLPPRPQSLADWTAAPSKLSAWVDDHFGGRRNFIRVGTFVRFHLFKEFPTIQMAAGQHGRYFLAAHGTNVARYQAITTVCGKGVANATTIPYLNRMFGAFHAAGLQPKLLVVPSAPAVHPEDVPPALVAECSSERTAVTTVLAAPELAREASANMFYPLKEMREIKKSATLFPDTWFHWTGAGLDQVARLSLTRFWQRPLDQGPALATRRHVAGSDVSHLFDGITLSSEIVEPDLEASGIKGCFGGECFPEVAAARILQDVSRFDNPRAPARRLLIVSDSFGVKIAPWYARYYRQVEHMATNRVDQLSAPQMAELKTFLYRDPAQTDILILYHDGGAMYDTLRLGTENMLPAAVPKQG
ncbi:hypothetical protein HF313_28515 [Massilia atriviolacea]|uniref:AlgX/AlgJ SGNH hydrolase-like domain-containing protein n=1 Tax=Massilia atriviolacea TaxID=2495579 RepID=A0A430HEM7_9BURK|nr:hypothetical protein [Massilia atriviolacea]RSZ55961.1 hypothetical protein EJB06_26500 [Massilia atriviolacea]